ncbi:Uncharacterised protein [uncultured archaeon]|nr:Uncharacterised protein [uncultured archaeon]
MSLHTFSKFVFDLVFTVFWIYIPMFALDLSSSPDAVLIWIGDLVSLAVIIYLLHRKGVHSIYSR